MNYRIVTKCGSGAFFVPNEAAKDLKLCTAAQLRVLLLVMSNGSGNINPEYVSSELGISVDDAKDILDYWKERGILEFENSQDISVDTPKPVSPLKALDPPEAKLTMKDVDELRKNNPGFVFVLHESERILGKTFTSADTQSIAWLISYAGIAPEVIVTIIEYCNTIGKKSMRYISKVATEWLDAGIDTVEKSEERIRALNEARSWEGEIKLLLEIRGRSLVTKESEYCETWRKIGISKELIRMAYERTIEQTGKLSFPYMNKILISWKQKGVSTPEEAKAEAESKSGNRKSSEEKPSFDIDEIERKMMFEDPVL